MKFTKKFLVKIFSKEFRSLKIISGYLSIKRKKQFSFLFLLMLISAFAEALSLASAVPFLTILSDESIVKNNSLANLLMSFSGVKGGKDLFFLITIFFATTVVICGLIRLLNAWLSKKFAARIGSDLSSKIYEKILYQPYEFHINSNTSKLIVCVTEDIQQTIIAFNSLLQILVSFFLVVVVISYLFIFNTYLAILTSIVFIGLYLFQAKLIKYKLYKDGEFVAKSRKTQLKNLQETLGGIREVIMNTAQPKYKSNFKKVEIPMRDKISEIQFFAEFPRYTLEVALLLLVGFIAFYLVSIGSSDYIFAYLGTFAIASQRLLPSIQLIYAAWARIKSRWKNMESVIELLSQKLPIKSKDKFENIKSLNFQSIKLDNLCFKYDKSHENVISEVNLTINRGERLGIIGSTGSGKSTLIDLIMGLLVPSSGNILINGKNIHVHSNKRFLLAWRKSIACVPQNVFLFDASIAYNITLGLSSDQINYQKLNEAAKKARIFKYINSLPNKFETNVGEKGIKLSGGQKQRIGIARAIYRNAPILVLDEATSALDNFTEKEVINNIKELNKDITIITIAHRISTLEDYDRLIMIKENKIKIDDKADLVLSLIKDFNEK